MARRYLLIVSKIFLLVTMVAAIERDQDFRSSDYLMPGVRTFAGRRPRTPRPFVRADDSPIFFPGEPEESSVQPPAEGLEEDPVDPVLLGSFPLGGLELPEDFRELGLGALRRINNIANINDFAILFNLTLPAKPSLDIGGISIGSRFGGNSDAAEGETFEMANCKPELVTVPLDLPKEGNTMFFPTCIRLEQCGGCCYGPLLTCRPTVTKVVKVKVLKVSTLSSTSGGSRRNGGRRRRRQSQQSYHIVEAVKHTACACGCKVREEDCHSDLHTYYEGECACVCKNRDEQSKCEQQNTTKYWDNDSCNCFCRNPVDCGSGEYFSQATCSCERLAARHGIGFAGEATRRNRRRRKPVRVPLL